MKRLSAFGIFLFVLFAIPLQAGTELDQLYSQLENSSNDKERVDLLNAIAIFVINNDPEAAKDYALQAEALARKINYSDGVAFSLHHQGSVYYYLDEYELALDKLKEAEQLFNQSKNNKGLGYVNCTKGEIYSIQGKYEDALTYLFDALAFFEACKDDVGLARVNNNIGNIQFNQNNFEEALKYFNQALKTADEVRTADASLYIGKVYITQNKFSEAQHYLEKSLEISKRYEDNYNISDSYYLLGRIDEFYGEYAKAFDYFTKAVVLKEQLEDAQGISLCKIHIGNLFLHQNKAQDAYKAFSEAKSIAQELGIREELKEAFLGLSNTFHLMKQYDSAYHYLNENNRVNQEILSEDASKKLVQLESMLASQKREAQIEAERAITEYGKKVMLYSSIAIIIVLLLFGTMMYSRYRNKKKANLQLEQFNKEIQLQRDIIEEHNRDILDSIKYAKRIQEAILPSDELMASELKNHFILYQPKDIVSGDFYWLQPLENEKSVLIASVDCTGHGVPGAFVSIVGYNGLNRAVKEFGCTQPARILDQLNDLVEESFRQKGSNSIRDGMDMTLCKLQFNSAGAHLEMAAANNPLWIYRKNGAFEELKADKQPIGSYDAKKAFTNHEIELEKGDTIYLFSDGFADQFGGDKGKKYKYSRLREFLTTIQDKSIQEQKTILLNEFVTWMGDHEQLDDICVIGIRV